MINKNILYAILKTATTRDKDIVLEELLDHVGNNYDYNDAKAGHIIGMLMASEKPVTVNMLNKEYIENNLNLLMYNCEKYNIKDIKATSVDNIDCIIHIEFAYLEKIYKDRSDISYTTSYQDISFVNNPGILK